MLTSFIVGSSMLFVLLTSSRVSAAILSTAIFEFFLSWGIQMIMDIKLRTAQIFNAPAQPNPELTARGMLMPEASAAKILIETE